MKICLYVPLDLEAVASAADVTVASQHRLTAIGDFTVQVDPCTVSCRLGGAFLSAEAPNTVLQVTALTPPYVEISGCPDAPVHSAVDRLIHLCQTVSFQLDAGWLIGIEKVLWREKDIPAPVNEEITGMSLTLSQADRDELRELADDLDGGWVAWSDDGPRYLDRAAWARHLA